MLAKAIKRSLEETILACWLFFACGIRMNEKYDQVSRTPDVLLVAVGEEELEGRCVVWYLCSFHPSKYAYPSLLPAKLVLFSFVVDDNSCSRRHDVAPLVVVRGVRDALKMVPTMLNSCSDPITTLQLVHVPGYEMNSSVFECSPT